MKGEINKNKILDHIKFAKYWLDKAKGDYQGNRFTSGNIILNLARAELTTAWEEAVKIKRKIAVTGKSREWRCWYPVARQKEQPGGNLILYSGGNQTCGRSLPR